MGRNYTKDDVLEAIDGSVGITLTVAQRLECSWETAKKYIDRWEETRKAFAAETEKILDVAESQVFKAVKNGDIATAKWILARKGRQRGYDETAILRTDDTNPININFTGLNAEDILTADNVEIGGTNEPETD